MDLINDILNLAALLLWFNWCSVDYDPFSRRTPATLAGTVRPAAPSRFKRWHLLVVIGVLLLCRALLYRRLGPAVGWVPNLDLFFVLLAFRGESLGAMLIFSFVSFLQVMTVFYFWLVALAVINHSSKQRDPLQKLLLLQLGPVAKLPRTVLMILPFGIVALLWMGIHPLLVLSGTLSPIQSGWHLVEQGLLIGAAVYLTLKILLPAFLFLYFLSSYVYLGNGPIWDFISATGRRILAPLSRLPLRLGKVDFAPLIGIVIILLAVHALPESVQKQLVAMWPQ